MPAKSSVDILNLIAAIQNGEKEKINALWIELLPWVKRIVGKYISKKKGTRYYELDDLINCSYFALLTTIENCIISEDDFENPHRNLLRFMKYLSFEIAGHTKKDRQTYYKQDRDYTTISYNAVITDDSDDELQSLIPDKNATLDFVSATHKLFLEQLHTAIESYKEILTYDEQTVIHIRYYDNMSIDQTALIIHRSRAFVRETEKKALIKYRQPHNGIDLRSFLT